MALATMPKRCRNLMAERKSDQAAARLVCRGPNEEGEGICILECRYSGEWLGRVASLVDEAEGMLAVPYRRADQEDAGHLRL